MSQVAIGWLITNTFLTFFVVPVFPTLLHDLAVLFVHSAPSAVEMLRDVSSRYAMNGSR